ncbi:MAG: hypothetical protein SGCHY_003060 [Lobulomycetales sp.]
MSQPPQTVVVVQQEKQDNLVAAGISPLCCFSSKKGRAVVCLGAGVGGIVCAIVYFGVYGYFSSVTGVVDAVAATSAATSAASNAATDAALSAISSWNFDLAQKNTYGNDYLDSAVNAVSDITGTIAMAFLVLAILVLVIDLILIGTGGFLFHKAKKESATAGANMGEK